MTKKLHILFICGWYPSKVAPNNGDFIQRHAEAVLLKHQVTVLHIVSNKNCINTIDIESKDINGVKTHIAYVKKTKNYVLKLFRFIKAYNALLKKISRFDVVHLNEIYPFGLLALHLKLFKKKPFIISEHWTGYLSVTKQKIGGLQKQIIKQIVKQAAFICPVTVYLQENIQKIAPNGNYISIPNVVNTDVFKAKQKENKTFKIVHVSNFNNAHKNIKGMLRVAKRLEDRLDNFEWLFIGGNGLAFKEDITNLKFKKNSIKFINHVSQKKLAVHLQEASVCVSFSNYETFGIVITEAIACGTPVVITNTGIATTLSNSNYCKIIPIKNEDKLFKELLNLYNTKSYLNYNINTMHNFIKTNYSKNVVSSLFSKTYKNALNL